MKLKYILPILCLVLFTSCSSDDDTSTPPVSEIDGLSKVTEIINDSHTIELYTKSGVFYTGYNDISVRIKDNINNSFFETATISWTPMMEMMGHSCPKSTVSKAENKTTVYNGYIVYQMTGMNGSGWTLKFNYNVEGEDYEIEAPITVMQNDQQNVTVVTGSDDVKYILAIIEPTAPEIATNNFIVGLYKMESMMSFPIVPNYTIASDPRMPAMGNHSSPNNTDLTYNSTDEMYHGDLSLTMTGQWILNLKLLNDQDSLLKGEDVTDHNTQSSLYLELEF